jgi:hypothetical protein
VVSNPYLATTKNGMNVSSGNALSASSIWFDPPASSTAYDLFGISRGRRTCFRDSTTTQVDINISAFIPPRHSFSRNKSESPQTVKMQFLSASTALAGLLALSPVVAALPQSQPHTNAGTGGNSASNSCDSRDDISIFKDGTKGPDVNDCKVLA